MPSWGAGLLLLLLLQPAVCLAELRLLTEPAHTALQLLQFDPLASLTQFEQRMARLPLIKATLDHTPASASIFFGYPTGDYFFVRRLHDADGDTHDVRAGEAGVIPAGFVGMFEVVSPVRKYFVVMQGAQ